MNLKLLAGGGVLRLDDNASIPPTLDNYDWRAYQAWLGLGNVPLPADQPTQAQLDDAARLAAIDATISGFSFGGQTIAQLRAMDNAAFDAWWAANITNLAQANTVLKLLARANLRRVL